MELVKQEHKSGCGIACIAMVMGKTYGEIVKEFLNDFDVEGMTTNLLMDYLGNAGFSIVFKQLSRWNHKDFAREEMLRPFAPVHILAIKWKADTNGHFVVMDKDGTLFCPSGKSHDEVKSSYLIDESIGIYR